METGTHEGGGVHGAVMAKFERILTCDVDPAMTAAAERNNGTLWGRIRYFTGQSHERLRVMLAQDAKAVVLLDAHPPLPYLTLHPLAEELGVIKEQSRSDHLIIVDDVDLCSDLPEGIKESEIKAALLDINPAYTFEWHAGLTRNRSLLMALPPGFPK